MMQAPITREEAQDVPLSQIEATLARLGRDVSTSAKNKGGHVTPRNSVMTLVAYARGTEQGFRVGKAVEGLTGQHPSRSIVLIADPDEPSTPLSASVSLHCHVPHQGGGQTCAEQVKIHAQGDSSGHLAGVVLPLLLTELPVFVWWSDGLPSGDLVQNLIDISDRVIVDSADFQDIHTDLVQLADLMAHQSNRTAFSDFNWSRLKSWRELTAQFFDAPLLRPYLEGVQRVEIEYAVGPGQRPNAAQANLFAGWLASRLRWQSLTAQHSANGSSNVGLRTHLGAPVTLEIAPRFGVETRDWWTMSSAEWPLLATHPDQNGNGYDLQEAEPPPTVGMGALMRVNIQARLNGKPATFTILREDDLKNATTVIVAEGESMPVRRAPLASVSETSLLHNQLGIFGHDVVYEAALQAAKPLVQRDTIKGRK